MRSYGYAVNFSLIQEQLLAGEMIDNFASATGTVRDRDIEELESVLDVPAYPAAEAARLIGLKADRVRRWLKGYTYALHARQVHQNPVVSGSQASETSYASFLDLIDLLFVKQFLDHGISLQRIRKALDEASHILETRHFARQSFFTDGKDLYLQVKDQGDAILELLSGGQWVIPEIITELAQQIEFGEHLGLARKWYPLGGDRSIVIDPSVAYGRPSIVGKGVMTANVYDFYLAEGREIRPTCRWLDLTQKQVQDAVQFEESLAA
ncbi:hypothetical protein KQI65_08675 [bacterium]|nr:hypothetical protein [bacterium]